MKFRASLIELACMRQFSNIIHTLSKLSKMCVLRICDDRLYFIVPEDHSIPHRISVWCVLHKNEFFNTYVMVGDDEKNEIFLEISSDMLSSSLSSIKTGNSVLSLKIKLTNRGRISITLELELASATGSHICTHDIPVVLICRREWNDYQEPAVTDYSVSIQMPTTKIVRNIVDKLKKISNKVTITATSSGAFSMLGKTTSASIEVHFKDLIVKKKRNGGSDF